MKKPSKVDLFVPKEYMASLEVVKTLMTAYVLAKNGFVGVYCPSRSSWTNASWTLRSTTVFGAVVLPSKGGDRATVQLRVFGSGLFFRTGRTSPTETRRDDGLIYPMQAVAFVGASRTPASMRVDVDEGGMIRLSAAQGHVTYNPEDENLNIAYEDYLPEVRMTETMRTPVDGLNHAKWVERDHVPTPKEFQEGVEAMRAGELLGFWYPYSYVTGEYACVLSYERYDPEYKTYARNRNIKYGTMYYMQAGKTIYSTDIAADSGGTLVLYAGSAGSATEEVPYYKARYLVSATSKTSDQPVWNIIYPALDEMRALRDDEGYRFSPPLPKTEEEDENGIPDQVAQYYYRSLQYTPDRPISELDVLDVEGKATPNESTMTLHATWSVDYAYQQLKAVPNQCATVRISPYGYTDVVAEYRYDILDSHFEVVRKVVPVGYYDNHMFQDPLARVFRVAYFQTSNYSGEIDQLTPWRVHFDAGTSEYRISYKQIHTIPSFNDVFSGGTPFMDDRELRSHRVHFDGRAEVVDATSIGAKLISVPHPSAPNQMAGQWEIYDGGQDVVHILNGRKVRSLRLKAAPNTWDPPLAPWEEGHDVVYENPAEVDAVYKGLGSWLVGVGLAEINLPSTFQMWLNEAMHDVAVGVVYGVIYGEREQVHNYMSPVPEITGFLNPITADPFERIYGLHVVGAGGGIAVWYARFPSHSNTDVYAAVVLKSASEVYYRATHAGLPSALQAVVDSADPSESPEKVGARVKELAAKLLIERVAGVYSYGIDAQIPVEWIALVAYHRGVVVYPTKEAKQLSQAFYPIT